MIPPNSSAFMAGNFQFVYKNCEMASKSNIPQALNRLNNVLFSHSLHPSSGNEWDLLYSVIAHQPCDYVCPICLFTPVAPRITKCGHIFCADCICQHLACAKQKICPVCFLTISQEELLRTDLRLYEKTEQITFQKVIKNRHNCCCFDANSNPDMNQLPYASQISSKFSHFMLADSQYVANILKSETDNLLSQKSIYSTPEFLDTPKVGMIESVLDSLKSESPPESNDPSFTLERPSETVVFMQDSFGRNIFIDKLSMKMLKEQFKDIKNFPNEITAKILKRQTATVTQRFRKQNPILGHLPSGAEVEFVLLDLENIVDQPILKRYSGAISDRLRVDSDSDDSYDNEEEDEAIVDLAEEYFPSLISNQNSSPSAEQKPSKTAWSRVKAEPIKPERKKTFNEEFPSLSGSAAPSGSSVAEKKKSAWSSIGTRANSHAISEDFPSLGGDFPSLGSSQNSKLPKRMSSWGNVVSKK